MNRTRWGVTAGSLLLPLTLVLGTETARAHGFGPGDGARQHPVFVSGVVTGVSSSNVQIQTQSGSVNAAWTVSSRVVRMVTGTPADLTVNAHVSMHLVSNTATVDAVQIDEMAPKAPRPSHGAFQRPTPSATHTTRHSGSTEPPNITPHAPKGPANHVDGQILKISGKTVTLRGPHGQTMTYTLANSVTVTKWMPGKFTDLAVGVQVRAAILGGRALTITILNA